MIGSTKYLANSIRLTRAASKKFKQQISFEASNNENVPIKLNNQQQSR